MFIWRIFKKEPWYIYLQDSLNWCSQSNKALTIGEVYFHSCYTCWNESGRKCQVYLLPFPSMQFKKLHVKSIASFPASERCLWSWSELLVYVFGNGLSRHTFSVKMVAIYYLHHMYQLTYMAWTFFYSSLLEIWEIGTLLAQILTGRKWEWNWTWLN